MVIKAALHTLRRPDVSSTAIREAVGDIDEEVARLNRIVNEVLDFARPIEFELAPTDLNALCRDSALRSERGAAGPPVRLVLDERLPILRTDADRFRIVLVNLLDNARHATNAATTKQGGRDQGERGGVEVLDDPLVTLRTEWLGDHASLTITDRGAGIGAADVPHVFDPYFTTKRGGTGLGLPIAKNIIEGLGGTIVVSSEPGRGTDVRIEIPVASQS
jgi:two-component system sensor histidine kinase HydH